MTLPSRRIWLIAITTALVVAAPIALFVDKMPWLISIPILLGTVLVVASEFVRFKPKEEGTLAVVSMPKNFLGLSGYRGYIMLQLPEFKKEQANQEEFFFAPRKKSKPSKIARIIKDESGEQISVIDCERFVTLLVNGMIENADQVAEISLSNVVKRYGQMSCNKDELKRILSDKGVLEVIKADYRGNLVQVINRTGEKVIRDLSKQAHDQKQKQSSKEEKSPTLF